MPFFLDLQIENIIGIFGFPIGAGQAITITDRSVRDEALSSDSQKGDEHPPTLLGERSKEVFERRADRALVLDALRPVSLQQGVVLFKGRVVRLYCLPRSTLGQRSA